MSSRPIATVLSLAITACTPQIGGDPPSTPDAGAADREECARVELSVSAAIPTVLLVVDRSGSMDEGFGNTDRWNATYSTLMDPDAGVVKQLESSVRFGVSLYTSRGGFAGSDALDGQPAGTCPMLTKVAPALGNHAAINGAYAPAGPVGDTPTGAALVNAMQSLQAVVEPGPKIIVLATDGLPDSCNFPNPTNESQAASARKEATDAAQAAYAAGIETYVISVGNDVGQAHLQDMANAGSGQALGGTVNSTYYQALDPAQLVSAFDDIITGVRSCVLTLDGQVNPDSAEGTVTMNGNLLDQGSEWQIIDGTTIELLGAPCQELLSGGDHKISAEFSCGAIVL